MERFTIVPKELVEFDEILEEIASQESSLHQFPEAAKTEADEFNKEGPDFKIVKIVIEEVNA